MKVVIYARYSSHNQSECSIEGQLEICRAYAQQNNFDIIGEYIDRAATGTTDNRPQFRKMIEDSEKQLFNGVLVYALDRFARNRYDSAVYKAKLKKSNIKVYSARENISDDPAGVLMESVLEGMAEYFSLELGQKVKRGMNLNAECCFYNGGSVPLGYKLENVYDERFNNNLKKAVKKQYVIDEEKAYIVKKIFEMYANDTRMVDIINYLNGLKLTTSKNNPFNKSSIGRILTNKKYIGIYSYNGIEKEDGIPRIIEDDLFEKVQRELVRNGLAPARSKAKTAYLLTGKLYCGKCKDKMTGTSGTSKTGKLHTYYMCKTAKHSKDLCNMGKVKRKNIEDIVVELAQSLLTSENINQVANKVVEIAHNSQDDTQLKRLQKSLRDEEKRKENTLKAVTVCEDDNTRKSLFDEIGNINENIKNIEKLLMQEESNHILISTSEIKFFLKQLMKGNIQDFKYRKMLINTLINRVYLYKSKIVIVYNINNREQEIEISLIKNIEGSTVDSTALPNMNYLNLVLIYQVFRYNIEMNWGCFMRNIDILKEILLTDNVELSIRQNEQTIFNIIPELEYEKGFDQKNQWHCYNVWDHTIHAIMASNIDFEKRLILLLHDIGKPFSFQDYDDIRHFHGHALRSKEISLPILQRLGISDILLEEMLFLIGEHASKINIDLINNDNIDLYKQLVDIQICDASAYEPKYAKKILQDLINTKEKIFGLEKKKVIIR